MGILMASMSLGRTIAPFTCGVMFESELWLSQDYNLTQTDGWFGREARDPACYASNATELAALGCTVPDCKRHDIAESRLRICGRSQRYPCAQTSPPACCR